MVHARILRFVAAGMFLGAIGTVQADPILYVGDYSSGNGSVNYFTTGGTFLLQASAPGMDLPGQMATGGPSGNLYVTDGQGTVDILNATSGAYVTQFGSFVDPSGLAFSPGGNLYISDLNNGSSIVDEFNASGSLITQVVGAAEGLDYANALAFGPDGNLYIADSSGNIYEYNLSTTAFTIFATESGSAQNLVFGPNGNLYVTNGNEVDVFNGTTGAYIGVFGNTTSLGANALGMAFGPDGNLYVADGNGVEVVNGATGSVGGSPFISVGGDVVNPQFLAFETPEPASLLLGALGLIAIASLRWRKRGA